MQDFKHFDPKQAAMDEARGLLEAAARAAMADGSLPEKELPAFVVEVPNDVKNGDLASNFAMAGARVFGMPPRKIAEAVAAAMPALEETHFSRVEIAGPGVINLFLAPGWFADVVLAANAAGADYGRTSYGKGEKVNVEFVSANPTGPMHLGNARGGALGDCLAAAMDWAGYDVTREFLINDAGNQILKFGKSLAVRYLQIFRGEDAVSFPEDCYQGADIRVLAQKFADVHGNVYMEKPFEELQKDIAAFALPLNVQGLKDDMAKYRVHYDVWFSETTLHESGAIREMLDKLAERGATYEKDGAIWYRSMQYAEKYGGNKVTRKGLDGEVTDEDKDEVLVRANGVPTYFAADIAYHYNKFAVRGFSRAIDVWGADHHGHVARMKGAMDAIGLDGEKLDIVLMQLVKLLRDGEVVRMSKRTGKAISLHDLLDEVSVDAARWYFNSKPDTQMEFDLGLAVREDSENPIYYVEYAHARICSLVRALAADGITVPETADLSLLSGEAEKALIKQMAQFCEEIKLAARDYDPSHINRCLQELAGCFHRFYTACRIRGEEPQVAAARLKLADDARAVLKNGLKLIGVDAPEKM